MPQTPIYERIKNATVAITSLWLDRKDQPFTIIGSGVCVDPSGLIVTCTHVIEAFMSKSLASQIAEMDPEKDNRGAQRGPEIKVARAHAIFFRSDISKTQLFAFPCPVDLIVAEKHFDLAVLRVAQRNAFKTGYPTAEIGVWGATEQKTGRCHYHPSRVEE
jgi:hypothetical protein